MTAITTSLKMYLTGDIDFDPTKRVIGGGFGDLFKGLHKVDGMLALKHVRSSSTATSQEEKDAFIREAKFWRELSHENVLPFYGIHMQSWNEVYLVSPWVENGSLKDYIATCPDAERTALGLAYLHGKHIVHGDLKGANALVNSNLRVVLCDFGLSKMAETLNSKTGGEGTIQWQSPELMMGGPRTFPADIYAFGIVIYEILSGRTPFAGYAPPRVALAVVNESKRPPTDPRQSAQGESYVDHWKIAERCWAQSADERPTITEVIAQWPSSRAGEGRDLQMADGVYARFLERGDVADIREAIQRYREILASHPDGHPRRAASLRNLGIALSAQDPEECSLADLAEAITLLSEGVQLHPPGDPDRAQYLADLGVALSKRYDKVRDATDITDAIAGLREAVNLCPPGHVGRALLLNNLGEALYAQYVQEPNVAAATTISEAIALLRDVLELRPAGHPERARSLNTLGNFLYAQYEHEHNPESFRQSCILYRESVNLLPLGHPYRPTSLFNHAWVLQERYEDNKEIADLQEAIKGWDELVETLPPGHADYAEARQRQAKLGKLARRLGRSDRR